MQRCIPAPRAPLPLLAACEDCFLHLTLKTLLATPQVTLLEQEEDVGMGHGWQGKDLGGG